MFCIDVHELVTILEQPNEISPRTTQPIPTQSSELLFNWVTTKNALKHINNELKVTNEAYKLFAFTMSSIADEVMEHILNRHICVDDCIVRDAFEYLGMPFRSFVILPMRVSLKRILEKYRKIFKFRITSNTKVLLASVLYSLMIAVARDIHDNRHDGKVLTENDVRRATDSLVYRRTYTRRRAPIRSLQASTRKRKSNGQFG